MRKLVVAFALLALFPSIGSACSFIMSPEFHLESAKRASPPPRIEVREIRFVPWISDSGSCDGVGFIVIELSGLSAREIRNNGFLIKVVSGANEEALFPTFPLVAEPVGRGKAIIRWAWTGISPGPDGHVRWALEIVPVSRSGVSGAPVAACAASDDSCPRFAGDGV
jgi:hypothetical protein